MIFARRTPRDKKKKEGEQLNWEDYKQMKFTQNV